MFSLITEYFFKSKDRFWALLLLFGALLCVAGSVALMYMLSTWFSGFCAALTAMSMPLVLTSLQIILAITIAQMVINVVKEYVIGALTIRWREWLTQKLVNNYTSPDGNNYLELERHPSQIDNPSQRIQQDIPFFVEQTLKLGLGLLEAVMFFSIFVGNLWVVGGAATFAILGASITIPGYLVWIAILFAITTTLITHFIGKALTKLSHQKQTLEAEFRRDVDTLSNNAESVAQDRGEAYFQKSIMSKFQAVCKNAYEILKVKIGLTAFNSFYQQISLVFPYIAAIPLYFAKKTTLGQVMEIGMSFAQIQYALTWFSNSYEAFASYSATTARIIEFKHSMADDGLVTTPKDIIVETDSEDETITVQNLNIAQPSSTQYMMRELTLTFSPGENTLIRGRSGLGKSTLFKALANVWGYGDGEIVHSNLEGMCFLPQRPVIHDNTLKAILAYPDAVDEYTDEECMAALRAVGGMERHYADLHKNTTWSRTLSHGEQQRISFARALLKKPTWLFLDEATSAIDQPSELHLYNLIKQQLKETTFISIAHRSTVDEHHDRIISLDVDEQRNVLVQDTFFSRNAAAAYDYGEPYLMSLT